MIRSVCFALLILASLFAGASQSCRAASADDGEAALALIHQVMDEAKREFSGAALSRDERDRRLEALVERYADATLASQDVLGRYWSRAAAPQQAAFSKLLVDYAVASWSDQLADLDPGQHIEIASMERMAGGRILVHSFSVSESDQTLVDWVIAKRGDGRLVIADVAVDGVSLLQTIKSAFQSILHAQGGSLEALMEAIRMKIASYGDEG